MRQQILERLRAPARPQTQTERRRSKSARNATRGDRVGRASALVRVSCSARSRGDSSPTASSTATLGLHVPISPTSKSHRRSGDTSERATSMRPLRSPRSRPSSAGPGATCARAIARPHLGPAPKRDGLRCGVRRALAEVLNTTVLTCDRKLAPSPGHAPSCRARTVMLRGHSPQRNPANSFRACLIGHADTPHCAHYWNR